MARWWGLVLVALALWPVTVHADGRRVQLNTDVVSSGGASTDAVLTAPAAMHLQAAVWFHTGTASLSHRLRLHAAGDSSKAVDLVAVDAQAPLTYPTWTGSVYLEAGDSIVARVMSLPSGESVSLVVWGEVAGPGGDTVGLSAAMAGLGTQLDTAVPEWPVLVAGALVVGLAVVLVRGLIRAGG